jgi:hypothetical protein
MKKRIFFLISAFLFNTASLHAAISSVTITPAPSTTLSNGNSYYLAGRQYIFRVQALDTAATGKADWTSIQLSFPSGESMTINVNAPPAGGTTVGGVFVFDSLTDATTVYTNIDFSITLRFRWDSAEYAPAGNTVTATVVNINSPGGVSNNSTFLFGKISSIRVVNFAQSGVASDGYVNPWHTDFNVTGTVTYNITGATAADAVETMSGDVNSINLYDSATNTTLTNNGNNTSFSYLIHWGPAPPPPQIYALSLGTHTWNVRPIMATPGYTYVAGPTNSLALVCDQIRIDTITIINGGGTLLPPYYRSVNISGTQIQISASRQSGAPGAMPMVGNTTITIRNITDTQNFTLQISNGAISGTDNVPLPSALPAPGSTLPKTYQVVKITGSAFDNEQDLDIPANAGCITQTPANSVIYWDRNDPTGNNGLPGVGETPFTDAGLFTVNPVTATSFRLNWQPLTDPAMGDPPYDGDFYTYRIYYRRTNIPPNPWTIVDRSTPGYASLGVDTTSSALITGLNPLTQYDYFMTAVDIFGQEVEYTSGTSDALYAGAPAGDYGQITTSPTEISASVTDGIKQYNYNQFETSGAINAANRPLRKSSIRITTYIVSSGDQPDSVNIILAQDDSHGYSIATGSLVDINLVIGNLLNGAVQYDRIPCTKSAPNTWQAYIPSNNRFLVEGQFCRFIIESIRNGTPTYSDTNSVSDGIPNDHEYTFMVQTPTNFQPWPTRVLNNVLTDEHPVCYPSYYLSDDAYVTITAYDIKGRPVATLLDNGFRKGGQNIKEGGWAGDNKARKKLGVGLYYIRFEAKRASDGRVILNQTEKVVIAK